MTICTDVYIRPQSCDVISIYPSQVHPFSPASAGGGSKHYIHTQEPRRKRKHFDTDEDVLAALGLFGPSL